MHPNAQQQQQQQQQRQMVSSPTPSPAFRSQRIMHQPVAGPPELLSPLSQPHPPQEYMSNRKQASTEMEASKTAMVGSIPVKPSHAVLESSALLLPFDSTGDSGRVDTILCRIFSYLRMNSIVMVGCVKDTGCLECVLRSSKSNPSSRLEFAVQLWRDSNRQQDSDGALWIEVKRRRGCSLEMNSTRRSLLRYILHASNSEGPTNKAHEQQQRPPRARRASIPDLCQPQETKRPRVLPFATTATATNTKVKYQDTLTIIVNLLQSLFPHRQKIGFESLVTSTNAKYVGSDNALAVSCALALNDSRGSGALQQRFTQLLRFKQPARFGDGGGVFPDQPYWSGSMEALIFSLALQALSNALDCICNAFQHQDDRRPVVIIDLNSPLWKTVLPVCHRSLEDAHLRPHEAALSAKIIRLLSEIQEAGQQQNDQKATASTPKSTQSSHLVGLDSPGMRAVVQRAQEVGRVHHLSLEQEARKLSLLLPRAS